MTMFYLTQALSMCIRYGDLYASDLKSVLEEWNKISEFTKNETQMTFSWRHDDSYF
jgi:hypothetical protein